MSNKRQLAADNKAQSRAAVKKKKTPLTPQHPEQRYVLQEQAKLDAADDSPNLAAEFVLVRQIIQRMIDDGLPATVQLPWIKVEESLARSMIAMGVQIALLVPATDLRDAARAIAQAVHESLAVHAPDVHDEALEWLKTKMGEALLDDSDRDHFVEMPAAKQVYEFNQAPASPNLSLGGSLRLLRYYTQIAINEGNWDFALLLIKQLITSAHTQLSLAKVEGVLVSKETSRRVSLELTSLVSQCFGRFCADNFEPAIDSVREAVLGPPKQTYQLENQ